MKKFVLLFALIATLSTTLVSCSADDSDIQTTKTQGDFNDVLVPPSKPKP